MTTHRTAREGSRAQGAAFGRNRAARDRVGARAPVLALSVAGGAVLVGVVVLVSCGAPPRDRPAARPRQTPAAKPVAVPSAAPVAAPVATPAAAPDVARPAPAVEATAPRPVAVELGPPVEPAVAGSGMPPLVRTGENLLRGCDFEGSALADLWRVDDNRGGFSATTAPGRSGRGTCAKLVSTSRRDRGKFHIAGQKLPAGADVLLSVWAKPIEFPGGAFLNIEGDAAPERSAKIDIAGGTGDWAHYELRTTTKGAASPAGVLVETSLWIYVYGAGTLLVDDIELRTIQPDPQAGAAWAAGEAARVVRESEGWTTRPANLRELAAAAAGTNAMSAYDALVRSCASAVSASRAWGVLAVSPTSRVFREGPMREPFSAQVDIGIARHERHGAQLALFALERDLEDVKVSVGEFRGPAAFGTGNVEVLPVGFGRHAHPEQVRWYDGPRRDWWPDALVPDRSFRVEKGTVQPVYLRVYCPTDAAPGTYRSDVVVTSSAGECRVPLRLTVHAARMPVRLTLKTMMVGGSKEAPYVDLGLEQRMGLGTIYGGMTWTKPLFPAKDGAYDFSEIELRLQHAIDRGLNAFALAQTPKAGKWGFPKTYTPEWKSAMSDVVRQYAAFLRKKGWFGYAYYNNIDEPWSDSWPQVREIFDMVRAADPGVRVFSCVNQVGAVEELKNHADVFDVYVQQYHQQQAAARQAEGKEVWWAVCVWPSERPNVFVESPLGEGRIIGWLTFTHRVAGFEYWSMTSWDDDWQGTGQKAPKDGSWMRCPTGVLTTAWQYGRQWRNGDGYTCYPGDGRPVNSLRFEAMRDGIEEHELLCQLQGALGTLSADDRRRAQALLDHGDGLITNCHVFQSDARALDERRSAVLSLLDRARGSK